MSKFKLSPKQIETIDSVVDMDVPFHVMYRQCYTNDISWLVELLVGDERKKLRRVSKRMYETTNDVGKRVIELARKVEGAIKDMHPNCKLVGIKEGGLDDL